VFAVIWSLCFCCSSAEPSMLLAASTVSDFKECLDDLEQQVADFTDEVQQLAEYTSESISFEVGASHTSIVLPTAAAKAEQPSFHENSCCARGGQTTTCARSDQPACAVACCRS
jgi:hypothetical protein